MFSDLNLPQVSLRLGKRGEVLHVFDPLRRKWLVLTPEEWVRQHWLHFLHTSKAYPLSLMRVESGMQWNNIPLRTDLICYRPDGHPQLLLECKAPEVRLTETAFDQLMRYQRQLNAANMVLSNGIQHFLAREHGAFREVGFDEIPLYIYGC
ncbi:MAG: type I restriction enzyme HsdR N-terminal domain-containing protein [Flavobacteriales bacterium]|jgi:hypothetical protein|nr:type I restriction enzyme HsdR N-terminal domain-containing protein [Flavobacteriales bacterium]